MGQAAAGGGGGTGAGWGGGTGGLGAGAWTAALAASRAPRSSPGPCAPPTPAPLPPLPCLDPRPARTFWYALLRGEANQPFGYSASPAPRSPGRLGPVDAPAPRTSSPPGSGRPRKVRSSTEPAPRASAWQRRAWGGAGGALAGEVVLARGAWAPLRCGCGRRGAAGPGAPPTPHLQLAAGHGGAVGGDADEAAAVGRRRGRGRGVSAGGAAARAARRRGGGGRGRGAHAQRAARSDPPPAAARFTRAPQPAAHLPSDVLCTSTGVSHDMCALEPRSPQERAGGRAFEGGAVT
jgi:hypothetical protein